MDFQRLVVKINVHSLRFLCIFKQILPLRNHCAPCECNLFLNYHFFSLMKDGDYNCDIPAQRSSKLNKWKTSSVSSMNGSISGRLTPTNGLCEPCNRNQELKVQQLASFEPENEAYFDEEIQEYRYVCFNI